MKLIRSLLTFAVALFACSAKLLALGSLALYETARECGAPLAPLALGFNTLTSLAGDIYAAMDVVSRELIGFIPGVERDMNASRLALNQDVVSPVTPVSSAGDITPAMSLPTAAYQTIGNKTLRLTKARSVKFSWTGEEVVSLQTGVGQPAILRDQFAQAMRTLVNEIEVDLATAAKNGASRAYGTAATTPFDSTNKLSFTAQLQKILDDNGAPATDRHLVIDTTAAAALGSLTTLTNVNESGDSSLLRQGVLGDLHGFKLRKSAQIQTPTSGTASGATTDNAGYAIGATTLTLASAGTGTILAGDVVTFAGDSNKYVVATGDADVSGGGTIVLAEPGLRVAMSAATKAITVVATSARNIAYQRSALKLATRLPTLPSQGDLAIDRMVVTDDRSGLSFEVAVYPGYRMVTYEVSISWGQAVIKAEHVAVLLG